MSIAYLGKRDTLSPRPPWPCESAAGWAVMPPHGGQNSFIFGLFLGDREACGLFCRLACCSHTLPGELPCCLHILRLLASRLSYCSAIPACHVESARAARALRQVLFCCTPSMSHPFCGAARVKTGDLHSLAQQGGSTGCFVVRGCSVHASISELRCKKSKPHGHNHVRNLQN